MPELCHLGGVVIARDALKMPVPFAALVAVEVDRDDVPVAGGQGPLGRADMSLDGVVGAVAVTGVLRRVRVVDREGHRQVHDALAGRASLL